MKKFMYTAIVAIVLINFASCKKDFDAGGTTQQQLTNEWWAKLLLKGQDQTGYQKYLTYNTSSMDSLWVDDQKNGYGFKVKAGFDASAQTFSTSTAGSPNSYYVGTPNFPATARIMDGKVITRGARSPSGVITDSIYFRVIFSDDPTDTFTVAGYGRTNRAEDDH